MASKSDEKSSKNKGGRPPHEYDDIIAAELRLAITFGIPQAAYEQYIGHDVDTLKKHYPDVFRTTAENPTMAVKWAFFKNCVGGNVQAQIFWLKTRCYEFQDKTGLLDNENKNEFLADIARAIHAKPSTD